jgi:hypothetical protein
MISCEEHSVPSSLFQTLSNAMCGAIPPLPQYVFMAWCLVKHRDNFTFTFYAIEIVPPSHSDCESTATKQLQTETQESREEWRLQSERILYHTVTLSSLN